MIREGFGINPKEKKGVAPSDQTNATPLVNHSELLQVGSSAMDKDTQIFVLSERERLTLLVAIPLLQNHNKGWLLGGLERQLEIHLSYQNYILDNLTQKLKQGGTKW